MRSEHRGSIKQMRGRLSVGIVPLFLLQLILQLALQGGVVARADGQARPAPSTAVPPASSGPVVPPDSVPSITTDFSTPSRGLALSAAPWLRTCEAIFQTAAVTHRASKRPDGDNPFSPDAIAAGRRCLQRIGTGDQLSPYDWVLLLRLAVALDDEALVQHVVMRQLAAAGATAHDRAVVMVNAINVLLHNRWGEIDTVDHATASHTTLARRYAAQLDTMQPAGEVLTARLQIFLALDRLSRSAWSADTALARAQAVLRLVQSVSLAQVPEADRPQIRSAIAGNIYSVALITYFKTPTHDNLVKFIAVRDSVLGDKRRGIVQTTDSLLAQLAPPVTGDFWFPSRGVDPPVIPAPGMVSLVVFIDPVGVMTDQSNSRGRAEFSTLATKLSALQGTYPKLQIVLVAMTQNVTTRLGQPSEANHDDEFNVTRPAGRPGDPNDDANAIAEFVRQLGFPGTLCVLRTAYHTEAGMTAIPLASPVLDSYHLDPRAYGDHMFLVDARVDARGEIIWTRNDVLDGHLLQGIFPK